MRVHSGPFKGIEGILVRKKDDFRVVITVGMIMQSRGGCRRPEVQTRILDAAVQLFAKVGFNAASTRELARLADINEATLFRYYGRKRDLFFAAVESELQNVTLCVEKVWLLAAAVERVRGWRRSSD